MEKQDKIEPTFANYINVVAEHSVGPQIEGLALEQYDKVVDDANTIFIDIDPNKLPLFGLLKYAEWINLEFFENRGYDTSKLYFCLLPQKLIAENIEQVENEITRQAREKDGFSALVDFPDMPEVAPMSERVRGVSHIDRLITSVETPAATYHYKANFIPIPERIETFKVDPNVRKIANPDQIEAYFERIWDIYNRQFKALVDDHPINGAIPREVLRDTLLSEGSDLYAYIDDDGVLQSFGYIVRDFELCPWLNKKYFDIESGGKQVMYMPGIATAPESNLSVSTKIMESLLYNNLKEFGEWVVTFECSNISSQYIPKLVEEAAKSVGIAKFSGLREIRHKYEVVSFG